MHTLVVYDSVYGNTEIIARAIGSAIPRDASVIRIGDAQPRDLEAADLLVIGSPTHGALPTEAVQALIAQIGPPAHEGASVATFDTRLAWRILDRWGGFAAPKMADALTEKGWTLAAAPEGFIVKGLRKGPLKAGEIERAEAWARDLAGEPTDGR
jgi:flavodoxin I